MRPNPRQRAAVGAGRGGGALPTCACYHAATELLDDGRGGRCQRTVLLLEDLSARVSGEALADVLRGLPDGPARAVGLSCAAARQVRKTHQVGPEVGPTSAFYSCTPTGTHGPTCIV
jgi:hypothetical protein